jgi:hypothetical protein
MRDPVQRPATASPGDDAGPHVYRSRVDWWLLVVLVAAMAVSLGSSVMVLRATAPAVPWHALAGLLVGFGLPLWVLLSTRYVIDGRELRVRSGPFSWRVPIDEITAITHTSNPLSSPALSLRRLRIEWGHGRAVMISPQHEEAFLREMERRRGAR